MFGFGLRGCLVESFWLRVWGFLVKVFGEGFFVGSGFVGLGVLGV